MATTGEIYTGGPASGGDRFEIGRVASRTFGVIGRNPLLFFGIALLFSGLPALALGFLIPGNVLPSISAEWIVPAIMGGIVYFILAALMQTGLVVATLQDLSGQRVDFGACIRRALVMLLPLIGMSIIIAFGVGIATLFLIIPGVILYSMWFVAIPALVEERRGVFAALGRSRQLTSGARWPIFGLIVAYAVLSLLISGAAGLLAGLAGIGLVSAVINALASMLSALIGSAGVAATYVELRTAKEGTNIETLAAVFA